jgi:hypothetical protein
MKFADDSDAQIYLRDANKKVSALATNLHKLFLKHGCVSYVKTIYIGYDIEGAMVAALYRHENRVEVAIALAENHRSKLLIDATHLTWRTMPVAVVVKSKDDLLEAAALIIEATDRVKTGQNTVNRSSEFFAEAKKQKRLSGAKRPN